MATSNVYKCDVCGKKSNVSPTIHTCSNHINNINRDFDRKDRQYRAASSPDQTTGKEGHTLHADYNQKNHLYTFDYRGHGMIVKEADMMWEKNPMNVLAEQAAEFIKHVDKEIGWSWKPNKKKLSHDEILAQLETVVKR